MSNPGTSGSDNRSIDHEDALNTEPLASDDSTSAARWAANEELSSFLELVARKPLTNFERKTMCCEYPRPNVDAVYTPELDDYSATLVQGGKAIDKDNCFLQDKVLDITGPLCMLFEHLTATSDSSKIPVQVALQPLLPFSEEETVAMDNEIKSLQDKGAIHKTPVSDKDPGIGRVLHCSSVGKPSKVSEISMEGHSVGIRLPSLWPSQCTESLHQAHETSGGDAAQNGRKANSLPRRHFDNGRKQTTCKSTCPVSSQYTGKSRLCGELREVSDASLPSDGIPRFPSGFNNYDSRVTPRRLWGPLEIDIFASLPIVPNPKVRKLEARFRSRHSGCFYPGLGSVAGLCPTESLGEYEKCTEAFRPNASNANISNKFFVSYIRPHRPVSSSTLAWWMKEALGAAKVDTSIFKAHSSWAAAATAAIEGGISLPQILTLADWSGPLTFNKLFYRPSFDAQPGRAVLGSSK
ncbi:hypothetical protein AWC38_SpisGene717 [Stylophora pistillata]|uniref:Tyr recombinase domain-containing protein n=1 Tax=Stylophora pistillata TaxID=50429 RepID=A0A2B4T1F5_STYPI|nr:hypothetical protein AWC38_SpisGene717 [Stylophora pistillata]